MVGKRTAEEPTTLVQVENGEVLLVEGVAGVPFAFIARKQFTCFSGNLGATAITRSIHRCSSLRISIFTSGLSGGLFLRHFPLADNMLKS
ncbi:unnamed protein product [Victoria cruziana]